MISAYSKQVEATFAKVLKLLSRRMAQSYWKDEIWNEEDFAHLVGSYLQRHLFRVGLTRERVHFEVPMSNTGLWWDSQRHPNIANAIRKAVSEKGRHNIDLVVGPREVQDQLPIFPLAVEVKAPILQSETARSTWTHDTLILKDIQWLDLFCRKGICSLAYAVSLDRNRDQGTQLYERLGRVSPRVKVVPIYSSP